jgi:hypothetical protein
MSSAGATEEVPEFYHFPPFFTLQPVLETRKMQMKLWHDFILRWHQVSFRDTMKMPPLVTGARHSLEQQYQSGHVVQLLEVPGL